MVRNDIKKSSLLRTKILIYAFNGRTQKNGRAYLLVRAHFHNLFTNYLA